MDATWATLSHLWGPVIGAFIVIPAIELASALLGNVGGVGGTQLLYGLILIVVVILRPDGIISLFDRTSKKQVAASAKKEGA